VEPIVSEELWDQCNLILAERKNGKTPSRRPTHLFTNIVHCHCGQKMYVPSNTPKYVCYKCRNKIPIVDLDGVFHEQLKNFFLSPKEMTGYLQEADETIKSKEELLKTLENEYQKLKSEMDKMMRLYLDDKISPDGFGTQYRPLEERSKQVYEQLPQLQGELDFLKIKFLSSDEVLTEARDLYSRWPSMEPDDKRKIVENITERITIGKDDITIDLFYLPSSPEMMVERSRNLKGSSPRPA
jgi:site-specific DNA recombinase